MGILEALSQPWPWYIAGPLIGLTVPLLLLLGNKHFGVSENFRTVCAMIPNKVPFLNYNWRAQTWNLVFALGILLGGLVAGVLLANPEPLRVASATTDDLAALGVAVDGEFVPASLFSWSNLFTLQGFILMVVGGFLIGFGTRYAGGCTSGHAIMGLSELQLPSLIAVIGFFAGGLLMTHLLLPLILSL
ncbi:MAG: YeeE/YedE family protein [Truepera sp.]|nr:YeeE/YedE family protein [Truepera sp.]